MQQLLSKHVKQPSEQMENHMYDFGMLDNIAFVKHAIIKGEIKDVSYRITRKYESSKYDVGFS